MASMQTPHVIQIGPARDRRVARAVAARRRLEGEPRPAERGGGRAWVNGIEVGGAREALGHLGESYD